MKAYIVREKGEFFSTVVFAETRGKARAAALSTECCECAEFTDIEVRRFPQADSQYKGRREMDWNNPEDRIFLVKEGGFTCEYVEPDVCADCPAKEYCDDYCTAIEESEAEGEV